MHLEFSTVFFFEMYQLQGFAHFIARAKTLIRKNNNNNMFTKNKGKIKAIRYR